jgi:antitoxin component YwqK of YwqJK toxin-antitoxin module
MKIAFLVFFFTTGLASISQKTESYYDFFWKPCVPEAARYFTTVEKTDSGWLRHDYYISTGKLQMRALFEDQACKTSNGNTYYFYANGQPSAVGRTVHGKPEGICVSYHSNGMMSDSAMFHNGLVVDKRFKWHPNGYVSDSISRINDSTYVHVGWFDDGSLAYAGHLVNGKAEGKWKYYHHNGEIAASETYSRGRMISAEYFDESGKLQADTSSIIRDATLKGGESAWKKYLEKNLYWPPGLKFKTPAAVTVGVSFSVDENGKVVDAEVYMPFHDEFDKIALKIIRNSPQWTPAILHNRKVKVHRRQPITFIQQE